jgi:hypothetical protein
MEAKCLINRGLSLEYRDHFEDLTMQRCSVRSAPAEAASRKSSTGAAQRRNRHRAVRIGTCSLRLLTTFHPAQRAAAVRQPPQRGTRYAAETYADSAGRKGNVAGWSLLSPRSHATPFLWRTAQAAQLSGTSQKYQAVSRREAGDRRAAMLDRHLPGSISFWERR